MREFQQKKKVRKFLYSPITVIVLVLIFLLLVRGVWNVYAKDREAAAANKMSQEELASLQDQQASIASDISDLSSSEGVERQIRENYSMAKPGEHLVIVVDNATTTATTTPRQENLMESVWAKIKAIF